MGDGMFFKEEGVTGVRAQPRRQCAWRGHSSGEQREMTLAAWVGTRLQKSQQ